MDQLAELLKGLDASEIEKAMEVLRSMRSQQPPAEKSDTAPIEMGEAAPAETPAVTVSSAAVTAAPATSPPAPEVVAVQQSQSVETPLTDATNTQSEGASQAHDVTVPTAASDDVPFAFGEAGQAALKELRVEERKARKAERRVEKNRAAAAALLPPVPVEVVPATPQPPAPTGLASFGFFSAAPKTQDTAKAGSRLFSTFVPDKRIVPRALELWSPKSAATPAQVDVPDVVSSDSAGAPATATFPVSFECWLEARLSASRGAKGGALVIPPPGRAADGPIGGMHSTVPEPYKGFDREVVFAGFYAIGYDPCQARPPYFGTYNNLQDGNVNAVELEQIGRFRLGTEMPRLSVLDYDYDSGDDWDAADGGEDIGASSASDVGDDDDGGDSFASSDLDFVASDDDDDGSNSECDTQRRIMEARQQRLRRLRGKEKLISSYSGPFVRVRPADHPLQKLDRLDRLRDLSDGALASLLVTEMAGREVVAAAAVAGSAGSTGGRLSGTGVGMLAGPHQGLMEAALKNRRDMSEDEVAGMHDMISKNAKLTHKMMAEAFRGQQMCIGVARAEIERTVKRFYERRRGLLVRRAEPWAASDERLFISVARTPKAAKTAKAPQAAPAAEAGASENAVVEGDGNDCDDEDDENENEEEKKGAAEAPVAGEAPVTEETASPATAAAAAPEDPPQTETAPLAGVKRPREEEAEEEERAPEKTAEVDFVAPLGAEAAPSVSPDI